MPATIRSGCRKRHLCIWLGAAARRRKRVKKRSDGDLRNTGTLQDYVGAEPDHTVPDMHLHVPKRRKLVRLEQACSYETEFELPGALGRPERAGEAKLLQIRHAFHRMMRGAEEISGRIHDFHGFRPPLGSNPPVTLQAKEGGPAFDDLCPNRIIAHLEVRRSEIQKFAL